MFGCIYNCCCSETRKLKNCLNEIGTTCSHDLTSQNSYIGQAMNASYEDILTNGCGTWLSRNRKKTIGYVYSFYCIQRFYNYSLLEVPMWSYIVLIIKVFLIKTNSKSHPNCILWQKVTVNSINYNAKTAWTLQ